MEGWEGIGDKCVTDGWEGQLTSVCHPSPVKVDKDRQMVVLEEEFQVRGWVGWDSPRSTEWDWETQGAGTDAKSLALGSRKTWGLSPSSAVTIDKRHSLYRPLFPHL